VAVSSNSPPPYLQLITLPPLKRNFKKKKGIKEKVRLDGVIDLESKIVDFGSREFDSLENTLLLCEGIKKELCYSLAFICTSSLSGAVPCAGCSLPPVAEVAAFR